MIKIGFTSLHPNDRFRSIDSSFPFPLRKLGAVLGTMTLEKLFHDRFRVLHKRSEWFESHLILTEFIQAEISAWPGPDEMRRLYTRKASRDLCNEWVDRSFREPARDENARLRERMIERFTSREITADEVARCDPWFFRFGPFQALLDRLAVDRPATPPDPERS